MTFLKELGKRNGTLNRIIEWNKLAEEETKIIHRFIFRWISFNGLYFAAYEMNKNQGENLPEWKIVEDFCNEFILKDKTLAKKIYSDDLKTVFNDNIKDKSRNMGKYLQGLENTNEVEKTCSMVMIAYKIRCRLFHGEKNPDLEVNETLCKASDEVIASIMSYILKENTIA